jgi:recombination protein RecR
MSDFAEPLARLIQEFKRLPGVGQKSAQRLAFFVLRASREDAAQLAQALLDVKDKLVFCAQCNNIADGEICNFCRDPHRDRTSICIVEEPHNILPIETTRQFNGLYHVLHGTISPLRGIGPDQLRLKNLLERLRADEVTEVIVATNPTVEGEATAMYISRLLKPLEIRVTRIAMGIPVGSDIEFADEVTMTKSLENRREI